LLLLLRKGERLGSSIQWCYFHARGLANPIYLGVRHHFLAPCRRWGKACIYCPAKGTTPAVTSMTPAATTMATIAATTTRNRRRQFSGPRTRLGRLQPIQGCGCATMKIVRSASSWAGDLVHSNRFSAQLGISPAIPTASQEGGRGLPLGASPLSLAGAARCRGLLAPRPECVLRSGFSVDCDFAARWFLLRHACRVEAVWTRF